MIKILYLAGPMTGIQGFNFIEFDAWAAYLRSRGFGVISPHEEDPPEVAAAARASLTGNISDLPESGDPVGTALRNVESIGRCQGVALLDDWYKSSGTRHEIETAHRLKLPVAPVWLWGRSPILRQDNGN